MTTAIIGVDCATDPRKTGLALGRAGKTGVSITAVAVGDRHKSIAEVVAGWCRGKPRVLLALDAPLGWPAALGGSLAAHQAGDGLAAVPNALFRRFTDQEIKRRLGKQPLDVGADRIARTAAMALTLLQTVRRLTGQPIPLAWTPHFPDPLAAVEVYPAGTLQAHGLPGTAYKKADQREVRVRIVSGLAAKLSLPADHSLLLDDADVLDAAVCVLAGWDFLRGLAVPPQEQTLSRKEGWIWVREPMETTHKDEEHSNP